MFKNGDLLIYKKVVCVVEEVKFKYINDIDYYILTPITDKSLKIQIPTNSLFIRNLITKEKVKEIIKSIPKIEVIKTESKSLKNGYKQLMQSGSHEDLIKIIKTTYLRNKERLDNNKKLLIKIIISLIKQKLIYIMNFQ